jgi:hypothetical protein
MKLIGTTSTCIEGSACDGDIGASTRTAAIVVGPNNAIAVTNCELSALGGWGILGLDAASTTISNVSIINVGVGGISVALPVSSPEPVPSSAIRDTTVELFGQTMPAGVGIGINGNNITVERCNISGGYGNGFVASQAGGRSSGSVLRNCIVHDNGHTDDMGICDFAAIHIGGAGGINPFFIHDNVFANISAFRNGGEGIYVDVSATGFDIRRNLVYRTQSGPFYWHVNPFVPMNRNAVPLVLDNNFFVANGEPNVYALSHPGPVMQWYAYTGANVTRNIVYIAPSSRSNPSNTALVYGGKACAAEEDPGVVGQPCTESYADNFIAVASSMNLYWNGTSGDAMSATFPNGGSLTSWQTTGGPNGSMHEAGSISKDPLFEDVAANDFRLSASSPALLELGIEQLE